MANLICTVRGCRLPLAPADTSLACPRGHCYDVARSGYVNLLQPQDKRSRLAGDAPETVRARRRLHDSGIEEWLVGEVLAEVDRCFPTRNGRPLVLLDVGCGDGFALGELALRRTIEGYGIDLSRTAVELAAKRYPGMTWIVGNADRVLPWADRTFDLATSITARRNGPELRRVLSERGRAVFAVPGEDDLIELREAVLGRAVRRDRVPRLVSELEGALALVSRRTVRQRARLSPRVLSDLLAVTYRGARSSQWDRAGHLETMEVTMSRELVVFAPGRKM